MKSRRGRPKQEGLTRDAAWVAQALRHRVGDTILIPREEIAARVRAAHPGVWRNRSGPHVATGRGLRELWNRNLLIDAEKRRRVVREIRVIERSRGPDGLGPTVLDAIFAPALNEARPFPKGSTSFGLHRTGGCPVTEGWLLGLESRVRHLRERLVDLMLEGADAPPMPSVRGYAGSVRLLRDIVNVACDAESAGASFILEAFGVDPYDPGLGERIARAYTGRTRERLLTAEARYAGRFLEGLRSVITSDESRFSSGKGPRADSRRMLDALLVPDSRSGRVRGSPSAPASSEERATPARRPRSQPGSRRSTRATRRAPSGS